jgi:hypothetical protein
VKAGGAADPCIVALGTSFRLVGAGPGDRDALLAQALWADGLGVPWLRVFDGGRDADAGELAEAAAALAWWREERRRRGWAVDLMVETHDSFLDSVRLARAALATALLGHTMAELVALASDDESALVEETTLPAVMLGGVALPSRTTELYLIDVKVIRSTLVLLMPKMRSI